MLRLQIDPPEGGRFIFGNNIGGIALSPDGRTAAFVASGNGKTGLWVRPLDGTTARLIAGTEGAAYPFWSPDSNRLPFSRATKLQRVDLAGGAPLVICDVSTARRGMEQRRPDLFGTTASGLFRVAASGGTPSPLTTLDASRGESLISGRKCFPAADSCTWSKARSQRIPAFMWPRLPSRERVRLLATRRNALYAPGGDGKGYLSGCEAERWWPRSLTQARSNSPANLIRWPIRWPRWGSWLRCMSRSRRSVCCSTALPTLRANSPGSTARESRWEWWANQASTARSACRRTDTVSLRRATRPGAAISGCWRWSAGVASRLTVNSTVNLYPVWSPDGRTIVFTFRRAVGTCFARSRAGPGTNSVSPSRRTPKSPPTGRATGAVLYHEIAPGTELRPVGSSCDAGRQTGARRYSRRPYLRTPFNESWGRFSPEASPRWVAYQSDETGRYEVYIQAFPEPRGNFKFRRVAGNIRNGARAGASFSTCRRTTS